MIDFVGDNRNQDYSYVYNKLTEVDPKTGKNAFDYVNEGNVKEGDEVVVFGDSPSVMDIANALNTIPYEVLTGINRRVKRVYYRE